MKTLALLLAVNEMLILVGSMVEMAARLDKGENVTPEEIAAAFKAKDEAMERLRAAAAPPPK